MKHWMPAMPLFLPLLQVGGGKIAGGSGDPAEGTVQGGIVRTGAQGFFLRLVHLGGSHHFHLGSAART